MLFDLQNELVTKIKSIFARVGRIEDSKDLFKEANSIGKDFQRRTNELIEETYK